MATVGPQTSAWHAGGDPDSRIRAHLLPGENLLWSGRPDPAVTFSAPDVFLVPFSLIWAGFALFWELGVIVSGAPPLFVLWGIPFVVMGLYFVFGRFIVKKRRKLRTAYGVTDRRAIVVVGDSEVAEAPIRDQPLAFTRSRDGRHGSVEFGAQAPGWGRSYYGNTGLEFFGRWSRSWGGPAVAFYDVDDFETLRRAIDRARSG